MAREPIFKLEVHGYEEIRAALKATERRAQIKVRDLLQGLAHYGLYWLRLYIPKGASGYSIRHTDSSPAVWRPGGGGGGGEWEAKFGVKRGDSMHPLYVDQGTGLYGFRRSMITPAIAPQMVFFSRGRWWKLREVKGQRPQHFLYSSFQQTKLYAEARMHTLGREILGIK